ncbi:MAG: glycosyltransferase, partial [Opitutaceae bacterium]
AAGDRLLRDGRFDLVYFSTTQFIVTALGRRWLNRYGVPFVVDIQDPWRTDYYERSGAPPPPGGWKYRFARRQAAQLEERSWRDAAGFVSVSEDYLTQLRARYAWAGTTPSAVIPFGAPETDLAFVRHHVEIVPAFVREPGAVHLVSVGAVGPIMRTALELLFAGVRNLRTLDPTAAARLRLHFVGTSYASRERAESSVLPVAQACGVADCVREEPGRVGYFTAIQTLLAADAVLIPGSNDAAYNPSKIATCFLAEKPTLALTPAGSALEHAVRELSFATVVTWPAPDGVSRVTDFLRAMLDPAAPTPAPNRNLALFNSRHTARARTQQQCALFDRAMAVAQPKDPS